MNVTQCFPLAGSRNRVFSLTQKIEKCKDAIIDYILLSKKHITAWFAGIFGVILQGLVKLPNIFIWYCMVSVLDKLAIDVSLKSRLNLCLPKHLQRLRDVLILLSCWKLFDIPNRISYPEVCAITVIPFSVINSVLKHLWNSFTPFKSYVIRVYLFISFHLSIV